MATATPWHYGHRRPRRREHVEISTGWSSGLSGGPDDVFSVSLRDESAPDAHGCAEWFGLDMSRAEAARLHASLGRVLDEHPES